MSRSADASMRCRLCGFEFDPTALVCHAACPLSERCTLICCPNCGYQVVDESKSRVVRLARRTLGLRVRGRSRARPEHGAIPLSHVGPGTEVEIRSLAGMPPGRGARLGAFGLVPGTKVTLLVVRPVPVVRIGQTELALSEEIVDQIWVAAPAVVGEGA